MSFLLGRCESLRDILLGMPLVLVGSSEGGAAPLGTIWLDISSEW